MIRTLTLSETGLHGPLPVDVAVKVTIPLLISVIDGVYLVVSPFSGLKTPCPPDQTTPLAPERFTDRLTGSPVAHMTLSGPASMDGIGSIRIWIVSVTGLQFPLSMLVRYNEIRPLFSSCWDGM